MKDLTAQQSKVLNCIEESINKTGFPPTRAEICQKFKQLLKKYHHRHYSANLK